MLPYGALENVRGPMIARMALGPDIGFIANRQSCSARFFPVIIARTRFSRCA
jgi:hypothetical protein